MSESPLVYLVDDDPSVLKALKRVFSVAGLRCEAFTTAQGFLDQPQVEAPACLVLDVNLPDRNGLDLQAELKQRGKSTSIVFITGHGSIPLAVQAMQAGAVHFLAKPFDNRELLAAVQTALDLANQEFAARDENRRVAESTSALTSREREIFLLVADGMSNKSIAAQLDISLQTVKLHRGRVMQKLQLDSVADLVRLAEKVKASPHQSPDTN